MWTYNYSNEYELYHYGVKGMRWGVRRFQNKNGTLTSAGKKRYSDDKSSKDKIDDNAESTKGKKFKLTSKQKKAIKIGVAVAGTALAAYGAYRLYGAYTGKGMKIDPNTGLRLLNKDMTDAQHLSEINPGRIKLLSRATKNLEIINGSSENCMLCTTAYEARKRGFDIRAGLSTTGYMPDQLFSKIYKNYKGTDKINASLNRDITLKNLNDYVLKQGDGARGNIIVWWPFGGGHSMIWENSGGKVKFMDGQTGQVYNDFAREILKHATTNRPIEMLRTDNLDFNYSNLKNVMNTSTKLKTYVDHGGEVAVNLMKSPEMQTIGASALAAGYVSYLAYEHHQYNKSANSFNNGDEKK